MDYKELANLTAHRNVFFKATVDNLQQDEADARDVIFFDSEPNVSNS